MTTFGIERDLEQDVRRMADLTMAAASAWSDGDTRRSKRAVGGIISAVFGIHLAIAARLVDLWSPGIVYAVGGGVAVVAALLFLVMGRSLAREDRAYTVRVLVPLHALRPTQGAVGMKAVAAKREKVERRTDSRKAIIIVVWATSAN